MRCPNCYRDSRSTARFWWGTATNIEQYLPRITCPILMIQGFEDQYGTMKQVEAIQKQIAGPVELLALENCGHSPQRDQPEATLRAITTFVDRIAGTPTARLESKT